MPYPDQSVDSGRLAELRLFEPLPFIVLAQLVVGQELVVNTRWNHQVGRRPALHPARR